jgi:hypothetical protein
MLSLASHVYANLWQIETRMTKEFAEEKEVRMRKHSQQISEIVRTSARRKQNSKEGEIF